MPNWCDTVYRCIGDESEIKELYNVLESLHEDNPKLLPNGFGTHWIGNVLHLLHYSWGKYSCRGEITGFYLESDTCLIIAQETAWGEQEGFREVLQDAYPNIDIYYKCEEPGNGLYITNSFEEFPYKFIVEDSNNYEYFYDTSEVKNFLHDLTGQCPASDNIEDIRDFIDTINKNNPDDNYIFLHEFSLAD